LTLEDLGNIGDFLGGIGVIVTLLYLAFQIRQNTQQLEQNAKLAELAALDATNMHGQSARSDLLREGAAELLLRGLSGEELEPPDQVRFDVHMGNYFYGMQGIFLRTQALNDGNWPGMRERVIRLIGSPGGRSAWKGLRSSLRADFRAEVEANLEAQAD
jgi:hypothetical protein